MLEEVIKELRAYLDEMRVFQERFEQLRL